MIDTSKLFTWEGGWNSLLECVGLNDNTVMSHDLANAATRWTWREAKHVQPAGTDLPISKSGTMKSGQSKVAAAVNRNARKS